MDIYTNKILKIQDLSICYPNNRELVLDNLNLEIQRGETLAVIGSSGCGKSTIAKSVLQILPYGTFIKGEIFVAGRNLKEFDHLSLTKIRGESIGLIFQDPMTRLNPLMSIGEHLLDTLYSHRPKESFHWREKRSKELLEKVGIESSRFSSYPHELSGGMKQRVCIALAISLNPSLIIADEPTTSLDVIIAEQIMSELIHLCKELNSSLLLISHDLGLAAKWCNDIAILDQGRIVEKGKSRQILLKPKSYIGKTLVRAAYAKEKSRSKLKSTKKIILEVDGLRCWHSTGGWPWQSNWLKAIEDVSFNLFEKETLGVVGISGCGKSTLCRALMGLNSIRGGEVKLYGQTLLDKNKEFVKGASRSIQMIFQDPCSCLNPKMTVGESISDPLLIHNLFGKSFAREKVRELLAQVGLIPAEQFENRFPSELSGGQQQRVAIARSLALEPKILICDESLSMLDSEIQSEVLELLSSLQKKLSLSILFITHDLSLATGFCDRILVLDQGRIIEQGDHVFDKPESNLVKKFVAASPRLPKLTN